MKSTDIRDTSPTIEMERIDLNSRSTTRVLLVELQAVAGQDFKQVLRSVGNTEVTAVTSLNEATEQAARIMPDVVLLVPIAPESEAFNALARLRACPCLQDVPVVVVLPADRLIVPRAQWLDLGPIDCVNTPIQSTEFVLRMSCLARLAARGRGLERLAVQDALTGLYNRRYLDVRLAAEVERARRYGQALSVVMTDIDHFKRINDAYGHVIGDIVLRGVARTLRSTIRRIDLAARLGGEEFAIVAPSTPLAGAQVLAERLRAAVAMAPLMATTGSGAHASVRVTLSFGVAAIDGRDGAASRDAEGVLEAADAALYRAKANGRNRVEIHDD